MYSGGLLDVKGSSRQNRRRRTPKPMLTFHDQVERPTSRDRPHLEIKAYD